jgi:hypothetical protein
LKYTAIVFWILEESFSCCGQQYPTPTAYIITTVRFFTAPIIRRDGAKTEEFIEYQLLLHPGSASQE